MPITDTTTNRAYQKPNVANALSDDVARIRAGLDGIDTDVATLLPRLLNTANGAASSPPGVFSGTWFSGGTATTTKPQLLIEPSGTTSTGWSTNGTGLGVNAPSGFLGRLLDLQLDGVSAVIVTYNGRIGVGTSTIADSIDVLKDASSAAAGGLMLKTANSNASLLTFGVSTSLDSASIASLRTGTGTVRPLRFIVGTNSADERMRIDTSGVISYNQPAPAAINSTATLTVANLRAGIITSTSAAATDMTLPTGTDTEAGFSGIYTNLTFEWSVINTGPSLVQILDGTGHTVTGSRSVATGTSARFASRRTASNTFVCYRLS